jgi:hypothetical protein
MKASRITQDKNGNTYYKPLHSMIVECGSGEGEATSAQSLSQIRGLARGLFNLTDPVPARETGTDSGQ